MTNIEEWKLGSGNSGAKEETYKMCCYIAGGEKSEYMADVRDLETVYPGNDELYIKDTETNQLYKLTFKIDAKAARAEMISLLGAGNVKII